MPLRTLLFVSLCACQLPPSPKTAEIDQTVDAGQSAEQPPSAPEPEPPAPPAPIKAQTAATLDKLGGQILSPDARVSLTVPPQALTAAAAITINKAGPATNELASDVYELGPNGQTFTRDVELCFSGLGDVSSSGKCLGYLDSENKWKCEDECLKEKDDGLLCGNTSHFTNFAILLTGSSSGDEECSSAYFGADGGVLESSDGLASVTIAKGGIIGTEGVRIRAVRSASLKQPGSNVYDFLPHGLTFQKDAVVCLTLTEGAKSDTACLGYYDEQNKKWVCEDTCLAAKDNQLCGKTDHFTNFALLLTGGQGTKCDK